MSVGAGGLNGTQVRAVSYGEARNRQVRAEAEGGAGRDNRRVSLVIDYAGPRAATMSAPVEQPQGHALRRVSHLIPCNELAPVSTFSPQQVGKGAGVHVE